MKRDRQAGQGMSKYLLVAAVAVILCVNSIAMAIDPDPLQPVKDQVYSDLQSATLPSGTGFTRDSYLETLDGIIGFFRQQQQTTGTVDSGLGSIIDPYINREYQYSTPYYALSGSVLYISGYNTDPDFLESVALALDRALYELYTDTCADDHGNFFTIPCVLAYENLSDHVTPARRTQWETWLTNMTTASYRSSTPNWMVTASCGEFLRYIHGFTTNTSFLETHLGNNIPSRLAIEGLYKDSSYPSDPMAYDGFARLNFELLLARGYDSYPGFPGSLDLGEYMRRGAWTGLLMQSPWGETPIGGRSAQHQWNETEMCFIYERWADKKNSEGDTTSAQAFKRAAHLAYKSVRRWIRPSGELWIVKNRMDPSVRWGYESYSSHSQYNMWAAGFLSMAWMYANETISEGPAPADIGGYAFELPYFHKAFANCQGLYLQLDMDPDGAYNTAGLVRLHKTGVEPLVCPSATTSKVGILSDGPGLGMGIGWYTGSGWTSLAAMADSQISSYTFTANSVSDTQVDFSVTYNLSGVGGATSVTENYSVTPDEVSVDASVAGSTTQTKMRYAAFVYDGEREFTVGYDDGLAQTKLDDSLMTMQLTSHPSIPFERTYSHVHSRNGYLEAIEGIVNSQSLSYTLTPELDPTGSKFTAANTFSGLNLVDDLDFPNYDIVASAAGAEQSGNPKENSYDDDHLTRWANTGSLATAWIEYDLGMPRPIDRIYISFYSGESRTYPLSITVDGQEVWSGWTSTSSNGWQQTLPLTTGQVVRITMTAKNSANHEWFSIFETKIGKTIETCDDVIAQNVNLIADISGPSGSPDCSVNLYDYKAVAEEWLTGTPLHADISGPVVATADGNVDIYDLVMLVSQWLNCNDPQNPNCP